MKKYITLLILCLCTISLSAQTFKVYQKNGTVKEYDVSKVESVVFAEKKTPDDGKVYFYWGTGTTPPTTESAIKAGTKETSLSNESYHYYNNGEAIDCNRTKCLWVAMPSNWTLKSWTDNIGSDYCSPNLFDSVDLTTYTDGGTLTGTISGDSTTYRVYTAKANSALKNEFTITAKR